MVILYIGSYPLAELYLDKTAALSMSTPQHVIYEKLCVAGWSVAGSATQESSILRAITWVLSYGRAGSMPGYLMQKARSTTTIDGQDCRNITETKIKKEKDLYIQSVRVVECFLSWQMTGQTALLFDGR